MKIFKGYNDEARLEMLLGPDAWNWQCRLLALLCQVEKDGTKAEGYAEEIRGVYEQKEVDGIQKLRFGLQNYNESVAAVLSRLPSLVWGGALPKMMDVTVSLPFDAPNLTGKLDRSIAEVRSLLDIEW
jgi:hypothetical protein